MLRTIMLAGCAFMLTGTSAYAWTANVDGPDVFGVTKVFAIEGGERESLVVQCDSDENLFIAYIFRKKEFETVNETPATLLIQINGEQPASLSATMRAWNDNYGGVVASGRTAENIAVVTAIGKASGKINIGFEFLGNRESASVGSRGSTAAMKKVMDLCKLLPPA